MLADLRFQYSLGKKGTEQTVVFGGGSAGGRGAMTLLDKVVSEGMLGKPATVLGFLDSPYYIDTPSYSTEFIGFAEQMRRATENFNVGAVVGGDGDGACATAYPGDQLWKCITGVYRIPFVTTRHLVIAVSKINLYILFAENLLENTDVYSDPLPTSPSVVYLGRQPAAFCIC